MGKRLTENLSSMYLGAANSLKPKRARRKIVAYVESYDDISFWRSLLADYENENRYFEVMLPSRTSLAKGKKSVLMNQLGKQLGENMIACVDSDYDYLLQGRTQTSRYMIECPLLCRRAARSVRNGNVERPCLDRLPQLYEDLFSDSLSFVCMVGMVLPQALFE